LQGLVPASYEVVYGHAWKTIQRVSKMSAQDAAVQEYTIAVDQIKK
jgi:hypothetical protein